MGTYFIITGEERQLLVICFFKGRVVGKLASFPHGGYLIFSYLFLLFLRPLLAK